MTICEVIKRTLDNTENESIVTVRQVEALTDELCKALQAEGFETHVNA